MLSHPLFGALGFELLGQTTARDGSPLVPQSHLGLARNSDRVIGPVLSVLALSRCASAKKGICGAAIMLAPHIFSISIE